MKDDFKIRLINEYQEVRARRERLHKFLNEVDENNKPCDNSRSLLVAQLFAMDTYIQVLRLRFLELNMIWDDFNADKNPVENDYSTGFDTAKEDIKEFAKNKYNKFASSLILWEQGYTAGMVDIIEHIERM